MGRAIVRKPQVFLMDEPLSNLDAKLRVQMRAEIARIQQEMAVTTIYVTHDQVEAMTMGDRVAVMRKGELQQMAEPQKLYDSPKNLFVASFIGSPSMNVFEANDCSGAPAASRQSSATRSCRSRRRLPQRHPALRGLRRADAGAGDPARASRGCGCCAKRRRAAARTRAADRGAGLGDPRARRDAREHRS